MKKMWHNRSAWRLTVAAVMGTLILSSCCDCCFEPTTMDGTWAGVVSDTYTSEGGSYTLEIEVSGSSITVTGGTMFVTGTTGTLMYQSDGSYTVSLDLSEGGEGQLYADPGMGYCLFFVHTSEATYDFIIGFLQKGEIESFVCTEADLEGEWEGTALRVDSNLEVTWMSTSSAEMYSSAGVILTGTDGDGDFTGMVYLESASHGFYISGPVDWTGFTRYALCTLSFDKQALAVGFMTDASEYSLGSMLPDQKFALWLRK